MLNYRHGVDRRSPAVVKLFYHYPSHLLQLYRLGQEYVESAGHSPVATLITAQPWKCYDFASLANCLAPLVNKFFGWAQTRP